MRVCRELLLGVAENCCECVENCCWVWRRIGAGCGGELVLGVLRIGAGCVENWCWVWRRIVASVLRIVAGFGRFLGLVLWRCSGLFICLSCGVK